LDPARPGRRVRRQRAAPVERRTGHGRHRRRGRDRLLRRRLGVHREGEFLHLRNLPREVTQSTDCRPIRRPTLATARGRHHVRFAHQASGTPMTSKTAILALLTMWGVGSAVPHQAWADEITSEVSADSEDDCGNGLTDKVWVKTGAEAAGVKIFL